MARKKTVTKNEKPKEIVIENGMNEAVGFGQFNPFNMPSGSGFPGTEQISNTDTLFKNLRWYLVSNFRQLLSELYVEIGLVQTVVDIPVDDAFRGGVEIKSQQLDEDQLAELAAKLDREDDFTTAAQACKWTRLFGGAGIIILTDQDPEEPLDVKAIGPDTPLEFRAVDMWELFWDKQNTEGYNPSTQEQNFEHYSYYGEKVHKSRVLRLKGMAAPSFIRPRLRGWGFSVVEILVRSINQYLKATDLGFEVLDEFKVDVYKIKNLVNTLMSPNGQQKISQRVQLANYQKNYQNAVVMDSEDDWDHKQLSFAGLAEAMQGIRMQVAADMRFPITKLFGQSVSGGMGNTDQNDMENYNAMVESQVRGKIKYDILRLIEIRCQQLFGVVPDDLTITFKPLRELSAEQQENVKTQKFNRLAQAKERGDISTIEFREACNKGALFDITLDVTADELNPEDPQIEGILADDGEPEPGEEGGPEAEGEDAVKNAEWEEDKHPRADDGKFGAGGGGASEKTPKGKAKKPAKAAGESAGAFKGFAETKAPERSGDRGGSEKFALYFAKAAAATNPKEKELFEAKRDEALAAHKAAVVDYNKMLKEGKDKKDITPEQQKEISDKVSKFMGEILKREVLRNALYRLGMEIMPAPYTSLERIVRTMFKAIANSAEFDKASYEADGGDDWIHPGRKELFENPGNVDEALWARAKQASQAALGEIRWQFVVFMYKKLGGKFT